MRGSLDFTATNCVPVDWCKDHRGKLSECEWLHAVHIHRSLRERELEAEIEGGKVTGVEAGLHIAKLEAEIERLKGDLQGIILERDQLLELQQEHEAEIERLKADLQLARIGVRVMQNLADDAKDKLKRAQAVIDSYYGCEIEPRMAAFLLEFRAALAAAKVTDGPAICAEENDRRRR